MKFKVGDKVVSIEGKRWSKNTEYRTVKSISGEGYLLSSYGQVNGSILWYDEELKLYEEPQPQIEFTYAEVFSRINNGEVYECTDKSYNLQQIRKLDGNIRLYFQRYYKELDSNFQNITINMNTAKFRLKESKRNVFIYGVQHQYGGRLYDFISVQKLGLCNWVVCDTSKGKSYGNIAHIRELELTEAEIKEYKECWMV